MAKKKTIEKLSLFEKINKGLIQKENLWFWIIFGITLLTGILLYDPRVSLSGDDSFYILRAKDFLATFKTHNYQGPLYPIVLSLVMAVFGFNLLPLKLFSLAALLGFFYFTFIAFRKHIPTLLLFTMLFLSSFNAHLLYFGSQTFSETFYMLLLSLTILVFFRFFIQKENGETAIGWKQDIKRHLLLALTVLAMVLTRSVGYSALIAIVGYFLFYGQWKNIGLHLASFLLLFGMYAVVAHFLWDTEIFPASQGSSLLNKNFYRPELGQEDLGGLIVRFAQNSLQYLSGKLYGAMGLMFEDTRNALLAIGTYLLAITTLIFAYKRNRYLFFTGLITGSLLVTTFIILQTAWNQQRLIMPVYPYILLLLFAALYYLLDLRRTRSWQFLLIIPLVVLLFAGIADTKQAVTYAQKIKTSFDGLTPDWYNYTKACRWVGENLKETEARVACRKPEIATIYGNGANFYGIYSVPTTSLETFLQDWEKGENGYALYDLTKEGVQQHYPLIAKDYDGLLAIDDKRFIISKYPEKGFVPEALINQTSITSPGELKDYINGKPCSIFFADSLLANLKRDEVTHVLSASLRTNPNVNNGEIISTVERYISYIAEKYPTLLRKIHQEGADNNEPAQIYRLEWDRVSK